MLQNFLKVFVCAVLFLSVAAYSATYTGYISDEKIQVQSRIHLYSRFRITSTPSGPEVVRLYFYNPDKPDMKILIEKLRAAARDGKVVQVNTNNQFIYTGYKIELWVWE